jgi:chemotaxis protein MotB
MDLPGLAQSDFSEGYSDVAEDSSSDSWVVAYADLITLLFVFVVLLLSISEVSRAKLQSLSQSFNKQGTTDLSSFKSQLDREIAKSKLTESVRTEFANDGLKIQFSEKLLFESGAAEIGPEGIAILAKLSEVLVGLPPHFSLAVEGHTDSLPIRNQQFASNWSLSASRAVNVVHNLLNRGFEKDRISVKAFADTRPITKNTQNPAKASGDTRWPSANRRVTITVY